MRIEDKIKQGIPLTYKEEQYLSRKEGKRTRKDKKKAVVRKRNP